jgi:hypothetical protein
MYNIWHIHSNMIYLETAHVRFLWNDVSLATDVVTLGIMFFNLFG